MFSNGSDVYRPDRHNPSDVDQTQTLLKQRTVNDYVRFLLNLMDYNSLHGILKKSILGAWQSVHNSYNMLLYCSMLLAII